MFLRLSLLKFLGSPRMAHASLRAPLLPPARFTIMQQSLFFSHVTPRRQSSSSLQLTLWPKLIPVEHYLTTRSLFENCAFVFAILDT